MILDVVIRRSADIFKVLACEDQALLIWKNTFLVLDLGLDVVDGVACLDIQGDGLDSQSLHEDLLGGLVLDIVVRQRAETCELACKNDTPIWWNAFILWLHRMPMTVRPLQTTYFNFIDFLEH